MAGATADGLCIVEVWESQAAWDKYFADRLGAVLQEVGRREPEILTFEVHNAYRHGR